MEYTFEDYNRILEIANEVCRRFTCIEGSDLVSELFLQCLRKKENIFSLPNNYIAHRCRCLLIYYLRKNHMVPHRKNKPMKIYFKSPLSLNLPITSTTNITLGDTISYKINDYNMVLELMCVHKCSDCQNMIPENISLCPDCVERNKNHELHDRKLREMNRNRKAQILNQKEREKKYQKDQNEFIRKMDEWNNRTIPVALPISPKKIEPLKPLSTNLHPISAEIRNTKNPFKRAILIRRAQMKSNFAQNDSLLSGD